MRVLCRGWHTWGEVFTAFCMLAAIFDRTAGGTVRAAVRRVGMRSMGWVSICALLATGQVEAQPASSRDESSRPTLLLRVGNLTTVPARELHDALRSQMVDWDVQTALAISGANTAQRVANARVDLHRYDAVVWVETDRYPERLVLLMRADGRPHAIGIRRAHLRWAERAALYVYAYARRILHRAALRAQGVRSRWFSVMPRNGWALRLEGFIGLGPRHASQDAFGSYQSRIAGASLRLGRWLTRFLRVDLRLHLATTDDEDLGPQGGIGIQLALVSPTALRMGVALSVDALLVSDIDPYIDDEYTWLGVQTWVPMVLGIDFARHGAIVLQVGPSFIKPPTRDLAVGVTASLGFEIDLGRREGEQ